MSEFELEPGEVIVLRHLPPWATLGVAIVLHVCLVSALMLLIVQMFTPDSLLGFGAARIAFFVVICLPLPTYFGLVLYLDLTRVTDRRVVVLRMLPWRKWREIRLQDIANVRRQGWRLLVKGGGETLSIFCPPFFAPRILAALGRTAEEAR